MPLITSAREEEVQWYDAKGEPVKVTKEKVEEGKDESGAQHFPRMS